MTVRNTGMSVERTPLVLGGDLTDPVRRTARGGPSGVMATACPVPIVRIRGRTPGDSMTEVTEEPAPAAVVPSGLRTGAVLAAIVGPVMIGRTVPEAVGSAPPAMGCLAAGRRPRNAMPPHRA